MWKHIAATHFCGVLSITFKVAEVLVHSFVISRLDALNYFLSGLPKKNFYSLQMVPNAVAQILTGLKNSPVLVSLRWLSVHIRAEVTAPNV